jgi:predicted TIM-barrel fold metal-dependent hydrolase
MASSTGPSMTDERELIEPLVIGSCDSHVGPRLVEDLRPYCPAAYRERFDEFIAQFGVDPLAAGALHPNLGRPGHHDAAARLADMDSDGVATEVLYHFSQNGEPFPFVASPAGGLSNDADDFELAGVGYHLYNEWLADFVAADDERLLGLAYLPMWDIDAAIREVEWARSVGLRGVNFPPPGRPGYMFYNDPAWEPFWSACEDTGMVLNTHSSGGQTIEWSSGPGGQDILIYEAGGYMSRRAVWWLILAGVFERHPTLKLVLSEQSEGWWAPTFNELDSAHRRFGTETIAARLAGLAGEQGLPRPPSAYATDHVFQGASFMSRGQAEDARDHGYLGNLLWGRDYPHVEGTVHPPGDPGAEPMTQTALRHVLSVLAPEDRARVAGETLVKVFGLDRERLAAVAARIGAPTAIALGTPPAAIPEVLPGSNAFLGHSGPWQEERAEAISALAVEAP